MQRKFLNFIEKKEAKKPISVITAYDFPTAQLAEQCGIDLLLVGDSVGTNVLGYASEAEVTMEDMVHHCKAVRRGALRSCTMADFPFGAAPNPFTALENAQKLISAGADSVKIEGWKEQRNTITYLTEMGISVCGHIGYNPQYHGSKARVFGKDIGQAQELIDSALQLEKAGAVMIVIEKVPEELCKQIAEMLTIPVIGIGSGRYSDGQVLVFHDAVGLNSRTFRHAKAFGTVRNDIAQALTKYKNEIEEHTFPAEEQVVHLDPAVLSELLTNKK